MQLKLRAAKKEEEKKNTMAATTTTVTAAMTMATPTVAVATMTNKLHSHKCDFISFSCI